MSGMFVSNKTGRLTVLYYNIHILASLVDY